MNKMVLIDLETQDFPVESGIFEVACLVVENYEIVNSFYLGRKLDHYEGPLDFGRGFEDISLDSKSVDQFKQFMIQYPYPLVAHNCPFDKKFLKYYQWVSEDQLFYCSMRAIRYEVKGLKSYSMKHLIKHLKILNEDAHTAMGDVMTLFELLKQIQPRLWLQIGEKFKK